MPLPKMLVYLRDVFSKRPRRNGTFEKDALALEPFKCQCAIEVAQSIARLRADLDYIMRPDSRPDTDFPEFPEKKSAYAKNCTNGYLAHAHDPRDAKQAVDAIQAALTAFSSPAVDKLLREQRDTVRPAQLCYGLLSDSARTVAALDCVVANNYRLVRNVQFFRFANCNAHERHYYVSVYTRDDNDTSLRYASRSCFIMFHDQHETLFHMDNAPYDWVNDSFDQVKARAERVFTSLYAMQFPHS